MRPLRAALALSVLLAQATGVGAAPGRTITLTLPSPGARGHFAILEVTVGSLPSGAEIDVTGPSGERLGTISPFNLKANAQAGTFSLPLPPSAVKDGRVTIVLSLRVAGESRTPTADEVKAVKLVPGPVMNSSR